MRENWYTKRLKDKRKETISATVWACTSALALILWHFAFGKSFTWTDYQLISTPLEYGFYSALVFVGPGAYLYYFTDFYIDLWHIFRDVLDMQGLHEFIKGIIWSVMILIVIAAVWIVVHIVNFIYSVLINLLVLVLYLCPPIGVGLIAGAITYLFMKKDEWFLKEKAHDKS